MNTNEHHAVSISDSLLSWIDASRPRTLPLALASIATGSLLAVARGEYRWSTILFALLTGLLLQVLSNYANDYGDALKGTDNARRSGPARAVQSGRITATGMKNGIILCAAFAILSGLLLVYLSLGVEVGVSLLFLALGVAALAAAIRYTVGVKAYGYKGLGDLFVFVFFGTVGVAGSWFLNTREWRWSILLPAAAIGFLSTGVLNLNNMRDMDNDRRSGKRTIAAYFGYRLARVYHASLIFAAFAAAAAFAALHYQTVWDFAFLLALPFFVRDVAMIAGTKEKRALDPFLKRLTLSSLLFALLLGVGFML